MSYPTFHNFCGIPEKSNLTVSGANGGDLHPAELNDLVGLLNNQPSVDDVAKAIALHSSRRGKKVDVNAVWDALPDYTKDMWRGTATKLLTTFFIRATTVALLLLAFTVPLSAQELPPIPDDLPPIPQEPVAAPKSAFPSYGDALAAAKKKRKPLVVFVGSGIRPIEGVIVTQRNELWGDSTPRIVLSDADGDSRQSGWSLPRSASDQQIRRVLGIEAERSAIPFEQPSQAKSATPDRRQEASPVGDDGPWLPDAEQKRIKAMWPKSLAFPPNLKFYSLAPKYQNLYTMRSKPYRDIHDLGPEHEFFVSGGMERVNAGLWRSVKGLDIPEGKKIKVWEEDTDVRAFALTPRFRWSFPVRSVAFDVLSTDAGIFEIRTQTKREDGWQAKVIHKEPKNFPQGYNGEIGRSCSSCHDAAESIVDVPGRIYRTVVWGGDNRIFSWRPFDESGQLDSRWPIEK